jgi:hypothetical protein
MLFRKAVTVRHSLLAAGAILVLGMSIYLVREVSRTPSTAQADRSTEPAPAPAITPASDSPRVEPPTPQVATNAAPPDQVVRMPPPDRTAPIQGVQPPEIARVMPTGPNPKLDAIMGEANRAYDHGEFEEAKQIAQKVLEKAPGNVRMLRVIVSSECIAGDSAEAQKYFTQLPDSDRAQMRTRCDRYGVTLKDP